MNIVRKYPPHETRSRARKWCDMQERAHSDVRKKLKSWGVFSDETEQIIAELISANYLNEERFATAFARGKFRIKGWGWNKIQQQLKLKGVSSYSIRKAREEIDPEEYLDTLENLLLKKSRTIRETDPWKKKQKLLRYAFGRGYPVEEINKALDNLGST